jgi:tRNA (guanine-N7-)-methyltransferase
LARQKLNHYTFSENAENVVQRGKGFYSAAKGRWNQDFFKNDNPITVELACGKGEYTVGLGALFSDRNFIGVDIKGDRIARGSRQASEAGLQNVGFLRTGIKFLHEFFAEDEIDEIWLVHPDPQVRDRDEPKRLTNPDFLKSYAKHLHNGGFFHLKTDNPFLYQYSLETLAASEQYKIIYHTNDLYNSDLYADHFGIKTHYERIFVEKGFTINYIKARLTK